MDVFEELCRYTCEYADIQRCSAVKRVKLRSDADASQLSRVLNDMSVALDEFLSSAQLSMGKSAAEFLMLLSKALHELNGQSSLRESELLAISGAISLILRNEGFFRNDTKWDSVSEPVKAFSDLVVA